MSSVNASPRFWMIVPAAGIGARMGAGLPKQYLTLGNKTLLEHTVERLLQLTMFESLLLVLHPQDSFWNNLTLSKNVRIQVVVGGDERSDSVLNALHSLEHIAAEDDWVLVHDAARPCVALADIRVLCAHVGDHPVGGILGIPVSDTLKQVGANRAIQATVDRSQLWQAQTPQMFRYGLLRNCLARAAQESKRITDEASALEAYGYTPLMVSGRSDNIKITRPEDMLFAQWILQRQAEEKEQE